MFKGLIAGIVGIYLSIVSVFHPAPPVPVQPAIVTETSVATGTPQAVTAPKDNNGGKTPSVTERLRQEVADLKKQVGAVTQSTKNTQTVNAVAPVQETPTKPADTTSTPANTPAPTIINVTVQQPPVTTTSVSQTTAYTPAPPVTPTIPFKFSAFTLRTGDELLIKSTKLLDLSKTQLPTGITMSTVIIDDTTMPNGSTGMENKFIGEVRGATYQVYSYVVVLVGAEGTFNVTVYTTDGESATRSVTK